MTPSEDIEFRVMQGTAEEEDMRPEYLKQQQIIDNSQVAENEHVLEALRKYAEHEWKRDETMRIWKGVWYGLAIVTGAALLIWWVWA